MRACVGVIWRARWSGLFFCDLVYSLYLLIIIMILYYATTSHLSFYQHYPRLSQCFFVSSDYYKGCHVSVMVQGVIIVIEFGWRACSKRYSTLLKCPPARSVPKRPSFSAVPAKKFSIAAGTISSSTGKKNTKVIAKLVSHPLTISSRKYSR